MRDLCPSCSLQKAVILLISLSICWNICKYVFGSLGINGYNKSIFWRECNIQEFLIALDTIKKVYYSIYTVTLLPVVLKIFWKLSLRNGSNSKYEIFYWSKCVLPTESWYNDFTNLMNHLYCLRYFLVENCTFLTEK